MPKKFVIIEYPGLVQNPDKALETMGGMHKLTKSLVDHEESPLTLSYRNERFAPVLTGSLNEKPRMLIAKKIIKRSKETNEIVEERIEFIQPVDKMITFRELCDFTFSMPSSEEQNGVRTFLDAISKELPSDFDKLELLKKDMLSKPSPLYPPPVFARTTIPFNYRFKQHFSDQFVVDGSTLIRKTGPKKQWELLFSDTEIPAEPISNDPLDNLPADLVDKIRQLFTERPVWLDKSLVKALNIQADFDAPPDDTTLQILQHYCYKFVNGPWRTCWIRRGYDPRRTSTSQKYQVLTTRRLKNQPSLNPRTGIDIDLNGYYQICDIGLAELRQVASHAGCLRPSCTEETGWMYTTHLHAIKESLKLLEKSSTSPSTATSSSSSLSGKIPVKSMIESIKADEEVVMANISSKASSKKQRARAVDKHVERQMTRFRLDEMPDNQWIAGPNGLDEEDGYELFGDQMSDSSSDGEDHETPLH